MRVLSFGASAVLVEVDDAAAALELALWARGRVDAVDIVPAARTVLFDGMRDVEAVRSVLATHAPVSCAEAPSGAIVEVPVVWDGPDLPVVAEAWEISVDGVVERLVAAEHVVAFCGFAPGFPYLTNNLALPHVPRRRSPRARVAPGSVGLAGSFTGIYPTASPGGWQLVGHTDAPLWDPHRDRPALLPPGTRVRLGP